MKKILAFLLGCLMLFSVLCVSVSALDDITFVTELKDGRLYGTDLNTSTEVLRALYLNKKIQIFDKDGMDVTKDASVKVGTGFTAKIDNRLFYPIVVMGDVDGNGELTSTDYILVKRAYLGTYSINSLAKAAAGVEDGKELRPINYIMVKRAYFGTYDINMDYRSQPYDPSAGNNGWSEGWV